MLPLNLSYVAQKVEEKASASNIQITERLQIGATIGALTREVFGLEVRQSGFHKMLIDEVQKGKSYDEIVEEFNNELGDEARALLQTLVLLEDEKQ